MLTTLLLARKELYTYILQTTQIQHLYIPWPVNDVDKLKQRLIEVWYALQQTIVDEVSASVAV